MVYKLKTDAETRAYVQLLMNFKGVRTENIFNEVNIFSFFTLSDC